MGFLTNMILGYLAYPFSTSSQMKKGNTRRVKHLVIIVCAIMLFRKSHHHIQPSRLRSVSIDSPVHEVETPGGVQPPKTFGFPECIVEKNAKYPLKIEIFCFKIISPSKGVTLSANMVSGKERSQEDMSTGSVNVRSNVDPPSQSEVFPRTEFRRLVLSSSTPTPTRTAVASSTTTCTTVSSSPTSSSSPENVPILRIGTLPLRPAGSAAIATVSTNSNAIPTPSSELYFSHYWDTDQANHVGVEEISQTLSISSDEWDSLLQEAWNTNAEWYRPPGRMGEGGLVAIGDGIRSREDEPILAVGGLVNEFPLNPDIFPAINGNPVMVNGIGSSYGGAPTNDPTDDWTQIDPHRHNLVEVFNPREIYDHQRTWGWLESNLSFPLRPQGRAQHQNDLAMQVTLIDDILYGSNDDELIENGDEEEI